MRGPRLPLSTRGPTYLCPPTGISVWKNQAATATDISVRLFQALPDAPLGTHCKALSSGSLPHPLFAVPHSLVEVPVTVLLPYGDLPLDLLGFDGPSAADPLVYVLSQPGTGPAMAGADDT